MFLVLAGLQKSEEHMDILNHLKNKSLCGLLSSDEDELFHRMEHFLLTPVFLKEITSSNTVILAGIRDQKGAVLALSKHLAWKGVQMPVTIPKRCSISAQEVSINAAITTGRLLKTALEKKQTHFTGVFNCEIGVGMNGSEGPGPLFWSTALFPGCLYDCRCLVLKIVLTYYDVCTNSTQSFVEEIDGPVVDGIVSGPDIFNLIRKFLYSEPRPEESRLLAALERLVKQFPFSVERSLTPKGEHLVDLISPNTPNLSRERYHSR